MKVVYCVSYEMTNLCSKFMHIMTDASALQKEAAFHLFSMGPDLYTLSQCEGSKHTPLYSRYITKDTLIAGIKHELLIGHREVDEKLLRVKEGKLNFLLLF